VAAPAARSPLAGPGTLAAALGAGLLRGGLGAGVVARTAAWPGAEGGDRHDRGLAGRDRGPAAGPIPAARARRAPRPPRESFHRTGPHRLKPCPTAHCKRSSVRPVTVRATNSPGKPTVQLPVT